MAVTLSGPRGTSRLAPALRRVVRAALAVAGRRAGEISLLLSDDATLRHLNRRWRRIDRATDVLSFSYADDPIHAPRVDGDLVISLDRLREQAVRFRVTRGAELARLVIHGALHLAGHDHHRVNERRTMRVLEEKAMRAVRGEIAAMNRTGALD